VTAKFVPPSGEQLRAIREHAERSLSAEQAATYLVTTDEEREEMRALIDWFSRRYPTPADRLRYARAWTKRLRQMGVRP
jgi:hypothetical protein